jgi:hypothetical protein
MLPPDKVEKLGEMLGELAQCQCLSPAEDQLTRGLHRLVAGGKAKLLFAQEFNTVRGWTERCAACPERKKAKKRA